ncbi:LNS2-domain-containing protein [Cutaneotrichosporon oleaginosum]|uniref:phosphatidate phosphatase n=1 Tax=Cutaneotrichosporon oleaginosum TaxID=879819 RepID=A0A0J0XTR4_9TREE|nr:LNS2-domain-containing protein [Cutaneotrichosporon oleaginosum]KLT44468.1 LNS2-domain-containing protein [Cutaneotrichosporon oleaginosum]TXT07813.1 hypothetical protein COLE_04737 [Cutaneotrichosporon oleaginosum]
MQYLSKAYNYYSGINPATLSGAIDIIVVRSVDENGEEQLAGSPFHVRFGKLQVLRAGEKRVTLRMPNNLPAPHIVPFSMKVSETGEAFFVLETEEEVPAELMTSPVVAAADADDVPPPSHEDFGLTDPDAEKSLTQHPFGATEKRVSHEGHTDNPSNLPDVEPFDLNAGNGGAEDNRAATPPAPELEEGKRKSTDGNATGSRRSTDGFRSRTSSEIKRAPTPPNPLEAGPGEGTDLPLRNWQLKYATHKPDGSVDLPKVPKGKHDGPAVTYGKDIVLDASGYHATDKDIVGRVRQDEPKPLSGSQYTESALPKSTSTPTSPSMFPRPDPPAGASTIQDEHVEELVNDLMASAAPKTDKEELSASLAALSLEEKLGPDMPSPKKGRAFARAQTEPPEEHAHSISRPLSPPGERIENPAEMDLAWDWSQLPKDKEDKDGKVDGSPVAERPHAPQRGESLPVALDGVAQPKPLATLKPIDDDNYTFMLQCDNRVHMFELSLCGHDGYAPEGKATENERDQFDENRVSFAKFVENAAVVDDTKLIVKYKGLYLSWKTGYHVLFALAIYRRSMGPPQTKPEVPQRQSGYWSRWWRRAESTGNAIERVQSASGVEVPPKEKPHVPPTSATSPPSEVPSPSATPAPASVPGTPPAPEPTTEEKHYAKTLRLSSDQLKELHLKPGPNTIQFSVTSSYSGNAVVTARIFLWEETDQVIISDIDGTITKSDALGHVFAAIGRDWTHVGIANLYTDITNNGYKIIYLTARAIGQADTTREYLKTIVQGDYRMPEGPVIMSPDRLMASLHREVILRKPELFKMACLRDIQRLFGKHAKTAFFAGFGNRITDAMSYRSVGIGTGKIYTIDSTGVILTELLQTSHRGSYVGLNDLVNEVFPPVKTKFQPQYTDFNYWKAPIADIPLPDFTPPSPALSARSDASGASRLSMLGRIATLGRRGSRSPPPDAQSQTSRPTSPLLGPSITADDLEEGDNDSLQEWGSTQAMAAARRRRDSGSSMPGSFESGNAFPPEWDQESEGSHGSKDHGECEREHENYEEEDEMFDDDILATGEMANVPF